MLKRIIDFHSDHAGVVLFGLIVLVLAGLGSLSRIPIDAFPDLTNNQVVVLTDAPGMAAIEIEQLVTFPIESAMMGLPHTLEVRSISKLELSIVTIVFEDHIDTYFARQLVTERLVEARARVPAGLEPTLGPVATAFGEVYQYTVEGDGHSPMELKTLHDWDIKYQLRAVPGVADINTWGGLTRQYEIQVDPGKLRAYDLSLRHVFHRISENNANFGGGFVEHASEQYTVRGLGRVGGVEDLGKIVMSSLHGTPIYLEDIAEIRIGAIPRQGAVTRDGVGESVSGMVIMLKGQNSKTVIERVKSALERIRTSLPEGVRIVPFYDQSDVIDGTIRTVRDNLLEGGALVVAVLVLFLGDFRAALIVASVIPLSMLVAFLGMEVFGISANLMSLGAIDFGMVVDGSVVMVENFTRRLRAAQRRLGGEVDATEEIRLGAHEVGRPILIGVSIIIAVYLPILTLEGLEGRMYRPMAVTVVSALLGSLILTLTVVPAASRLLLRARLKERKGFLFGRFRDSYERFLAVLQDHPFSVTAITTVIVSGALASLFFIGTEFMPRLDEGSMLIETRKLPSISLTESVKSGLEVERVLREFPEVNGVVTKSGRPDLATEAMGIYQGDVYVDLKPRDEWSTAATKEGLIEAMSDKLALIPGVAYNFTQPMAMRLGETISGVKADVAVKLFGPDEDFLEQKADEILSLLSRVPGAADVQREVFSGAAEWQVHIKREELARYGLDVADVRDLVEAAVGGKVVTELIDGRRRFQAVVRFSDRYRKDRQMLGSLRLTAPGGEQVPLSQVTDIRRSSGPEVVQRQDSQRRIIVQANVRGRDLGGFVEEAQAVINGNIQLPFGYHLGWGGQFEHQERAMARLGLVLPIVLLVVFFLLFSAFGNVRQALLVLLIIPFATVGGVGVLWLREMNLNVSASVGFIAVSGVAILNGVVLVSTINRFLDQGQELKPAIRNAAALRLRPVLMTSLVATLGFLPMATAASIGAEIQRPLASVVIGGLLSSTVLTLLVLPVMFLWFRRRS